MFQESRTQMSAASEVVCGAQGGIIKGMKVRSVTSFMTTLFRSETGNIDEKISHEF